MIYANLVDYFSIPFRPRSSFMANRESCPYIFNHKFREIGHSVFFSSDPSFYYATPVPLRLMLLLYRGPAAIARLIVSVVIRESVYRMLGGWTFAHIFEKVTEIAPSITKLYVTTSVILERFCMWVRASTNHIRPRIVSYRAKLLTPAVTMFYACVRHEALIVSGVDGGIPR